MGFIVVQEALGLATSCNGCRSDHRQATCTPHCRLSVRRPLAAPASSCCCYGSLDEAVLVSAYIRPQEIRAAPPPPQSYAQRCSQQPQAHPGRRGA